MRHYNLHTLPTSHSATLVFAPSSSGGVNTYYANSVLSSLPMSDLVLFSVSPAPASIFPDPIDPKSSSSSESHERGDKRESKATRAIRTLPVNPYPAQEGTPTRLHLVSFPNPASATSPTSKTGTPDASTRTMGLGEQAGVFIDLDELVERRWAKGRILGYRDRAGREALASQVSHFPFVVLRTCRYHDTSSE